MLTLVHGGRSTPPARTAAVPVPAPFIVAPPALMRLDRTVTADEIDMIRCRRLHPAAGAAAGTAR